MPDSVERLPCPVCPPVAPRRANRQAEVRIAILVDDHFQPTGDKKLEGFGPPSSYHSHIDGIGLGIKMQEGYLAD